MSMRRGQSTVVAAVAATARYSGLGFLVRHTIARRKVGIVVYHDPSPDLLRQHLEYLGRRFTFIRMERLATAIAEDDWESLPAHPLIVTFDDGHRRNAELAAIFEEHGVMPLIYLCSGIVAGDGSFWFLSPGLDPEPLKLMTPAERDAAVAEAGRRPMGAEPRERDALTVDQVRELEDVADFGSHTVSHPILPLCDDSRAEAEITASRDDVESLTGQPCLHFSYPNGDFTERELRLVRGAGYLTARTTLPGWNGRGCDPYLLRIVSLADHASVNVLAAHLAGLFAATRRRIDRRHCAQLDARLARREGSPTS